MLPVLVSRCFFRIPIRPCARRCWPWAWATRLPPGATCYRLRPKPWPRRRLTPQEALLVRYCQFIALKRYSSATLKNYRGAFQLFLAHCAPRLPLELARQEVLDYLAGRVAAGFSRCRSRRRARPRPRRRCWRVAHGKLVKVKGMPKESKLKLFRVLVSPHRTYYLVTNELAQNETATAEAKVFAPECLFASQTSDS